MRSRGPFVRLAYLAKYYQPPPQAMWSSRRPHRRIGARDMRRPIRRTPLAEIAGVIVEEDEVFH